MRPVITSSYATALTICIGIWPNQFIKRFSGNNEESKPTRLILPVGPTGQYPILANMLNETALSLRNCHFFFMDEYCDADGITLPSDHPLSFRGIAKARFLDAVSVKCGLDSAAGLFSPTRTILKSCRRLLKTLAASTRANGGIGIHGHIAFNEPDPGVSQMSCRKVRLNDFTVTINAIRADVGGNLEAFPRFAYTLGMKEILSARRIRLYCRNGIALDWANTVLRLALFAEPGDDYPVTAYPRQGFLDCDRSGYAEFAAVSVVT